MMQEYLLSKLDSVSNGNKVKKDVKRLLEETYKKLKGRLRKKYKNSNKTSSQNTDNKTEERLETTEKINIRFNQKDYVRNFKEKAEENRSFSVRLIKEQNERRVRQKIREGKVMEKLLKELKEQEEEKRSLSVQQEQIKKNRVQKMAEKSKERKQNISFLRSIGEKEYKKAISSTPLYKKIETDFMVKVELPELEKRKTELLKKREIYKPINFEELNDRARALEIYQSKHKEQKKLEKIDYFPPYAKKKSKFLEKILEEENALQKAKIINELKKKELLEKKKQYSEIIKDIYQPSIDFFKQREMDLIKAKLNNPSVPKVYNYSDMSERVKKYSPSPSVIKKIKIDEKSEKKLPVVKDYIKEMREARKKSRAFSDVELHWDYDSEIRSNSEIKKLQKKANLLDREFKLKELSLGDFSPYYKKTIETTESASNLIINSIKAKLAILKADL